MQRSRWQRFRTLLLLILLLALMAWGLAGAYAQYSIRPVGGQVTSDMATTSVTAGEFTVTWDADAKQLRVRHADAPERDLWASPPGRAFVAAGAGDATVTSEKSHFHVQEQRLKLCPGQTVVDLVAADGDIVLTGRLDCRGEPVDRSYALRFTPTSADRLAFNLTLDDADLNRLYLTFASTADEHFYGFGEQFSFLNMKGRRLPIMITDQGIGRGRQPLTWAVELFEGAGGAWHTSYAGVPQFLTSDLRSLYLENAEYVIFDLRRANSGQIQLFATEMNGAILYGESPPALIAAYTDAAGRMRPLPAWITSGVIIGMQGGDAAVRDVYARLQAADVPVAGFWLQDWVGNRTTSFGERLWWNWVLDENRYPAWDALVADLAADGVAVLIYNNPHVTDASGNPGQARNLLTEAAAAGYLVRTTDGEPYMFDMGQFDVGMIDLTDPAAWAWYKEVIRAEMVALGVKGWMADFGEGLPCDAVTAAGATDTGDHNRYPELWAQLNREVVDEAPNGEELVFFQRAAFTHSPQYTTLFWTGDQLVSWDGHDGIKSAVTAMLSSGFSGFAYNHSDTGGYTGLDNPPFVFSRDAELLQRWMELSAFTVIYRTHEGNRPADNAQVYDDGLIDGLARTARIYAAWEPYRQQLVAEAAATGLPVVRHPFIHYPDDPIVRDLAYQFMVGSEFMIAPVLDPGVDSVRLYLPAGAWIHAWSGTTYGNAAEGGWVTVDAPLGEPAVFYRAGSAAGAQFMQALETYGLRPERAAAAE